MIKTLADALAKQGYETLTPVQIAVSDDQYDHADLLVSAQTGSGKTVGFGLAIGPTILDDNGHLPRATAPLAIVIAPTRELAMQVKRELTWLYGIAGATMASCVGGMDMRDERRTLDRGSHIVVATPGRLRDHVQRGSIDLSNVKAVVLDEADEMLDLGFREDLEFILGEAPEERRTLMFSATVPRSIASLAKSYQKDAQRITTVSEASQHTDIEYMAMNVSARDGENAIINVLRYYEAPNALVFCNTRAMVNRLTTRLSNRGFSVVALSGELSQTERTHALQAMRDGRARVCVATDVAARGIDLPKLDLVVHAELPQNHETMLHRSGRTGRAGRKGVSAMIVPGRFRKKAERLLSMAKVTANWGDAPSAQQIIEKDQERLLADETWATVPTEAERGSVTKLMDTFTQEQLATAFFRLYVANQSAPEELAPSDAKGAPKPRGAFGPTTWFSISGGRETDANPRRLMPMLCKAGNLSRDDIGAIRVQDRETFVEILTSSVDGFLRAIGSQKEIEPGAWLKQLDKAPNIKSSPRERFDRKDKAGKPFKSKKNWEPTSRDPREQDDEPRKRRDFNPNKNPETRPEGGVVELKSRSAGPEKKPRNKNKGKPDWSSEGGKANKRKPKQKPNPNDKPNSSKKTKAARGKNAVLKKRK
jgi:ATP-dependent RNA helicase DeaD